MIFDVASAQHTSRIDIFEASEDIRRRLSRHQDHDVQPPAMAHPHDDLLSAQLPRPVQGLVQKRKQSDDALEREALRSGVTRLENLLEQSRLNQAHHDVRPVRRRYVGLKPFRNPAALLGQRDVHELGADLAAVNVSRVVRNFPCKVEFRNCLRLEVPDGVKVRLKLSPAAERVEYTFLFFPACVHDFSIQSSVVSRQWPVKEEAFSLGERMSRNGAFTGRRATGEG